MKRSIFIVVFLVLFFSMGFVPSAYPEDLKPIIVYGRITYFGEPIPGSPVYLKYITTEYKGDYVSAVETPIAETLTDQYGHYYVKTFVDADLMKQLAEESWSEGCSVAINVYPVGLYLNTTYKYIGLSDLNVDLLPGNQKFKVDVDLKDNIGGHIIRVSGIYLDGAGNPVANAKVKVWRYDSFKKGWVAAKSQFEKVPVDLKTNADGSFVFWLGNMKLYYIIKNSPYIKVVVEGPNNSKGYYIIRRKDEAINGHFEDYDIFVD